MIEMLRVLRLAGNDFSYFFRTKWLMAILLSLNLSDMLVVALVYRKLMTFDYFQFFVPAVIIMGLFVAALDTGRRIWLAIREGVIHYYLSLPISTIGIVCAYLLAGGLAAVVYSGSLLLIALIVLPAHAVWNTLVLFPFLFVLAMGLAGIAATLAALASTHGEFFFAYQQIVQIVLLTLSTVFYPIDVIRQYLPDFLVRIVSANPLSLAADAMRKYTFAGFPIEPWPLTTLLLASLPFTIIGALAYLAALHTIQVKGKL
ncbi:MAG: ABC transporter permease [Candidatus Bathyarchaeota archaeon]|nr:ABC transporter permease [Candidatus Bathyarchaeota archaeon]UCD39505.1 MAG: ABC transporter permease [Candidatus Bathyarchaeota archaeon]